MGTKALVIPSNPKKQPPANISRKWIEIPGSQFQDLVQNISTPEIGEDENIGKVSSVISGMPTILARADMFKIAFDYDKSANDLSGLSKFYNYLTSEWRGLLACIALKPDKISVKRIELSYSDGETIHSNPSNLYEFKGSLGNVLFDRDIFWKKNKEKTTFPFIDVLLYTKQDGNKVVIGANSPYTIFFTASNYNLPDEDIRFISTTKINNDVSGKFSDPLLLNKISVSDVKKIKNYVDGILDDNKIKKLHEFYSNLTNDPNSVYYNNIHDNLTNWSNELESFLKSNNYNFEDAGETPQVSQFGEPFNIVLNNKVNLFGYDGIVSTKIQEGDIESIEFEPGELLAKNDTYIAAVDDDGNKDYFKELPIILLKAKKKGDPSIIKHYTLPITSKGIKVFGKNIQAILDENTINNNIKTTIKAFFTQDVKVRRETVEVRLTIESDDGKTYNLETYYKVTPLPLQNKELIVWPNFISNKWHRYFMYSEMPHNSPNWRAVPFCAEVNEEGEDKIITDPNNNLDPLLIADNCNLKSNDVHLHVELTPQAKTSSYEYEIFESNNPFKGLKMYFENKDLGYVIFKYSQGKSEHGLDLINFYNSSNLKKVTIGIDFGSTNSAVAHSDGINAVEGITFKNRRRSIFRNDNKDNKIFTAGEDEIFFFQNDIIEGNELKSVLTTHDKNRISKTTSFTQNIGVEVKGGFPCFEKNLPIEDRTENTYLLNFTAENSIGNTTLHHNMKWDENNSDNETLNSYRKAYLGSLLLEIYAEMFADNKVPEKLKWSFPSAMISDSNLYESYQNIWRELKAINPLFEDDYPLSISDRNFRNVLDISSFENLQKEGNANIGGGLIDSILSGVENSEEKTETNTNINDGLNLITDTDYNFKKLNNNDSVSLTEAEAVANYIATNKNFTKGERVITLCFDIGGSTTDIMVLTKMKPEENSSDTQLCMIKQSSIKFAAQKVSHATKYSKNFKNVLIEVCSNLGLNIQGLNSGENKFTSNTAPYYFEQIVDRLKPDEFDDFYRLLGSKCKDLVSVNLFVTGLIIYYAGQLAKKVKLDIDKSNKKPDRWGDGKVSYQIIYTGKGSRIMDWLNAIDSNTSQQYYLNLFLKGFGFEDVKNHIDLKLGDKAIVFVDRKKYEKDVKYEVAKGLAASSNSEEIYTIDSDTVPLELIGEDDFYINTNGQDILLNSNDYISSSMMEKIGQAFIHKNNSENIPCPKFKIFAEYYYGVASKYFNLKISTDEYSKELYNIHITDYIRQLPEFKKALADKSKSKKDGFNFVSPILILEGMCFYEDVILQSLK